MPITKPVNNQMSIRVRSVHTERPDIRRRVNGQVFTGRGRDVVMAASKELGIDSLQVLGAIVGKLLAKKGADWTNIILSEYFGLYPDSTGIFSLVWDALTGQFVSHASVFRSTAQPWAGLLAHVRTLDSFQGLGLGTLVTEEVTAAAFNEGASVVVLATDDKLHRLDQGERAAHSMYMRLGYAPLSEIRLTDTIDRMLIVNEDIFRRLQLSKRQSVGMKHDRLEESLAADQAQLIAEIRDRFCNYSAEGSVEPVSPGDLANLFVLLNLCPPDEFRLKLNSWHVHHGPELERTFITTLRPAIVDQDRLHDASIVFRDREGAIIAVCGAHQLLPFTRQTYAIDFYCLPHFLNKSSDKVTELVNTAIKRIQNSQARPHPCKLVFAGADAGKITLFQSLGFTQTGCVSTFYAPNAEAPIEVFEFLRTLP